MSWGKFATGSVTTAQVIRACDQGPPSWGWGQHCFTVPSSQALRYFLNQAANLNGLNILMNVHNWLSKNEGVHASRHTWPSHICCAKENWHGLPNKNSGKNNLCYTCHTANWCARNAFIYLWQTLVSRAELWLGFCWVNAIPAECGLMLRSE